MIVDIQIDDWSFTAAGFQRIAEQLHALPPSKETHITLHFDSAGGDTANCEKLVQLLRPFQTTAIISRAHSSAALLAVACDRRLICQGAEMSLHAGVPGIVLSVLGPRGEIPGSIWQRWARQQQFAEQHLRSFTRLGEEKLRGIMSPSFNWICGPVSAVRYGLADEILPAGPTVAKGCPVPVEPEESNDTSVRRYGVDCRGAYIRLTGHLTWAAGKRIVRHLRSLQQGGCRRVTLDFASQGGETQDACSHLAYTEAFRIISLLRNFQSTAIIQWARGADPLVAMACQRRFVHADGGLEFHDVMVVCHFPEIGADRRIPSAKFRKAFAIRRAVSRFLSTRTTVDVNDIWDSLQPASTTRVGAEGCLHYGMADVIIR